VSACFECGADAEHHHHVIPQSLGGTRTVPLCARCHALAHGLDGQTWESHRALTRAALAAKRARGELVGTAPLGQRVAADGVQLEADPREAEALALVAQLRADGLSVRAIAAELNRRGVPCRGGRWHATTVARLLSREQEVTK
jgi:hypothetical protein